MDTFEKGESIPRTVTLTDDDSNVIDTVDLLTISVRVYSRIHDIIGTYTLADSDVVKQAPTSGGKIFFIVPATATATARAMKYFYRITTTETNADYPTGVRTRIFNGWCFDLKVVK